MKTILSIFTVITISYLFAEVAVDATHHDTLKENEEVIVVTGNVAALPKYRKIINDAGTLVEMPPEKVPFVVDTFTEDFIEDRNTTDLDQLLSLQPGIHQGGKTMMSRHAGAYTIRGYGGNEVLLNGTPITGGTAIYMDTTLLESVSIVKGPVGGAYGSQSNGNGDALGGGGSIILRTKQANFEKDFTDVLLRGTYSKASGSRIKAMVDINQRTEDGQWAARLPVAYEWRAPGWAPAGAPHGTTLSAAPSISFKATERLILGADFFYQYSDQPAYQGVRIVNGKPIGMGWDGTYTRPEDYMKYQAHGFTLRADGDLTDWLETHTRFSFTQMEDRYDYRGPNSSHNSKYDIGFNWENENVLMPEGYNGRIAGRYEYAQGDRLRRHFYFGENLIFKFDTGDVEHKFLVGFDSLVKESSGWGFFGTTADYSSDSTRTAKIGITLQELMEWKGFALMTGLRSDFHNSAEHAHAWSFSPRFGLSYDIMEEGWAILFANLSYTETPNFYYKKYPDDPGSNAYLTSSWRSVQKEVGLRVNPIETLWLTASAFRIDQCNTPVLINGGTGDGYYSEEGKSNSRGVEFSAAGDITENWSAYIAYAYTDYTSGDVSFDRYPPHAISAWTSYKAEWCYNAVFGLGLRWRDDWEMTFRGQRADPMYHVDDLLTVDASVEVPISEWASVSFAVRNIFDSRGVESARNLQAFANDGRTFELSWKMSF
ncbi:MAG: TonB-dependent receptor [bacterium]|nr:TonB-dependent receptor [bacterium]